MKKGSIRIGTSGWHYKHWNGTFYPEGTPASRQFAEYSKVFDTVELNNSFYHLPAKSTYEKWQEKSPENFLFSVKGSRYITHMKKLLQPREALNKFLSHAAELGHKLGPVLFQLPPGWNINADRLREFLELLPADNRYAFEFRNTTWYAPVVYEMLHEHNAAFCIYELDNHRSPKKVTADFVYVRLHGPGGKYQGRYHMNTQRAWANQCKKWQREGKDVYVYYDNDEAGYAAFNAQELKELTE